MTLSETPQDSTNQPASSLSPSTRPNPIYRARFGLVVTMVGFVIFLIGSQPAVFGMDRSPVIGFVQIAVFLIGLAIICLGGYASLINLWGNLPKSIAADIGVRLVATGYVISVFAGMADIFGFGSNRMPNMIFGPWQARGVILGEVIIAIGFLMLIPYPRNRKPD